jgi:LmbE family N-acetylglucosaminyl deacetylase
MKVPKFPSALRHRSHELSSFKQFVSELLRLQQEAKHLPLGGLSPLQKLALPEDAPKVLIFAPHPDDEVIIGGLPLRLHREARFHVLNVAVTQGSNKARQSERWNELGACCDYIGFGLIQTRVGGLEGINLKSRESDPARWQASVERIAEILREQRPRVIFVPHDRDWNISHTGTHHLVMQAVESLGEGFSCYIVETEFWGAMDTPNLMVESSEQDVTDLISALSFHVGEVRRNPYHLRMPAWLVDNVRRGGELVGGQGGAAPDFAFATLYRLRRWHNHQLQSVLSTGRFLPTSENPLALFT